MKKIWLVVCLSALVVYAQNIIGTVKDAATGAPLPGILVCNELESVRTDADGKYTLPRHNKTRFVSVVIPSDRRAPVRWHRLTDAETYDFVLEARTPSKHFRFMHLADTETGSDEQILKDIIQYAKAENMAFILHTGDICRAKGLPFHAKNLNETTAGRPVYYTVGNHDLTGEDGHGESQFEELFGPTRYAFEEGGCIFVMTPMIRGDHKPSYSEADIALFVHNLLALVPKEQPLYLANHYRNVLSPDNKGVWGPETPTPTNLNQWNFKAFIYGHTHKNHAEKYGKGMLYNTAMSRGGGLNENPASFRVIEVDENGACTSQTRPLHLDKNLAVAVSPKANADGKYTIAAFVGHSLMDIHSVATTLPDGTKLPLTQSSQLMWTGSCATLPNGDVTVTATLTDGSTFSGKGGSSISGAQELGFELERVAFVPGLVMLGAPAVAGDLAFFGIGGSASGFEGGAAALDLATGKLRWFEYIHSGVRNSPVYADGKLIVCDANNIIHAFDPATGKTLWLNKPDTDTIEGNGYSAPLVVDGIIYAGTADRLRAVTLADGKTLWTNTAPGRAGIIDQPILHNGRLIYTAEWDVPRALDAKTGALLWKFEPPPKTKPWMPTLAPLDNERIVMLGGQYSAIIESATGKDLVHNPSLRAHTTAKPVLFQGNLYKGTPTLGLLVLDPETLKIKYKLSMGASILRTVQYNSSSSDMVDATPIIHGEYLYVAHAGGRLYRVKPGADKASTELKYLDVHSPLHASPVIQDGRLILTDYAGRVFIFRFL